MALMPETKHCLPAMSRMEAIACMVSSAEVEVSKNTAIMVQSPALNASYTFWGSISMGTEMSSRLSYQSTVSTCSTVRSCSSSFTMSLAGISSTIRKENAPFPNSSIRIS